MPHFSRSVIVELQNSCWHKPSATTGGRPQWLRAIAQVERTVRIEPRNVYAWHKLATLQLAAGDSNKAEQFARRSNQFATGNSLQKITDKLFLDSQKYLPDKYIIQKTPSRIFRLTELFYNHQYVIFTSCRFHTFNISCNLDGSVFIPFGTHKLAQLDHAAAPPSLFIKKIASEHKAWMFFRLFRPPIDYNNNCYCKDQCSNNQKSIRNPGAKCFDR